MGFFSRLNSWQKGAVAGFLFTAFMALVFTLILIGANVYINSKGLPVSCYMLTHWKQCELTDALLSLIGFFAVFLLAFGIPISAVGGFLGWILGKVRIR